MPIDYFLKEQLPISGSTPGEAGVTVTSVVGCGAASSVPRLQRARVAVSGGRVGKVTCCGCLHFSGGIRLLRISMLSWSDSLGGCSFDIVFVCTDAFVFLSFLLYLYCKYSQMI